jgi:hypothetical protein
LSPQILVGDSRENDQVARQAQPVKRMLLVGLKDGQKTNASEQPKRGGEKEKQSILQAFPESEEKQPCSEVAHGDHAVYEGVDNQPLFSVHSAYALSRGMPDEAEVKQDDANRCCGAGGHDQIHVGVNDKVEIKQRVSNSHREKAQPAPE